MRMTKCVWSALISGSAAAVRGLSFIGRARKS